MYKRVSLSRTEKCPKPEKRVSYLEGIDEIAPRRKGLD
jgi:hypothetical protein